MRASVMTTAKCTVNRTVPGPIFPVFNAMRYRSTHPHRQRTDVDSCSVKNRSEETPSIERRPTLSDWEKYPAGNVVMFFDKLDSSYQRMSTTEK